jgi:Mg/Co/Ni transporter MgtE
MISEDIKSVTPNTSWKEVAITMSKYNLMNIPILSETNQLLGIVSVDDLLPWLLEEKK